MEAWIIVVGIIAIVVGLVRYIHKSEKRYIDERGYERDGFRKLIHRQIAFRELYDGSYDKPFREYVVHHKDRNKLNNAPDNLEILLPAQHNKLHGF